MLMYVPAVVSVIFYSCGVNLTNFVCEFYLYMAKSMRTSLVKRKFCLRFYVLRNCYRNVTVETGQS